MRHATACKFCQKPIFVEIDDSYQQHGDPFNILPMAACNPCADMRVERRLIERRVQLTCRCMELSGPKSIAEDRSFWESKLTDLTQTYAKLIARWYGMCGMTWDAAVVDCILDKPTEWGSVLGQMWKIFKQANPQHKSQQPQIA